jgi:hypothetical protein
VLFHAESGASPTINISTLGARKLYQQNGTTQIGSTEIAANFVGEIVYDATLDSATGGFRVVNLGGGGSSVTFNSPYMVVGGQNYLFGQYAATIPPTSGSWTLASTQAADAVEAAGAALRIRMSTGSTAINIYSIPLGTSRTVTAVVMGDPAFSGDASCFVGVGRAAAGSPGFWQSVDNRSGGVAPTLLGVSLNPSPGFGFDNITVSNIGYAPGIPQFYRFRVTGGNVLTEKSGDYGLTWTTFNTRTETAVFGGAVANTDVWYFGGRQGTSGLASSCTLLSWRAE